MENDLNSLFKKPKSAELDSLFKKPEVTELDTLFKKPEQALQTSDPRNGLSTAKIREAESNKSWAKSLDGAYDTATKYIPTSIMPNALKVKPSSAIAGAKGFTHNMDEYGASINKGLSKLSKAILPEKYQTTFFDDNAKFWNDNRKMNEIETEDNKYAHLAGEMLADPVNLTPVGVFNKGGKAVRVVKSMVAGAGIGAGTTVAKNYGNDSLTDIQKEDEVGMGAGIVSVLNGVIAGVTKGRVSNAGKMIEDAIQKKEITHDEAIDAVIANPKAFGLTVDEGKQVKHEVAKQIEQPQPELIREKSDGNIPATQETIDDIFTHPRAKEAIDLARDRYASQTYNDRVGGGSASWMENGDYKRAGAKGETNYHQGFNLSKADVKKINDGKITPEIEQKLRDDVDRLENDPNWNSENTPVQETHIDENGDLVDTATGSPIFANAGHNLAGGFGTGTVNAGAGLFDGSYDPNKDLSSQMADRFIKGMVAGVAGVQGLRVLRKTNPEAFKKVQSWVMDNNVKVGDKIPTDGVQLGVFAGKKAKGFKGKATHQGKYDGQTRFEIDDSNMEVIPTGVTELASKGYTGLDKVIKHDELFDNYPQLRNVIVKFDKNMESHATFDGEHTITLSNKFKNKDEMSSSIIHEIQHWVQNKEGFAGGGNFDDMMMQVEGKIYNLEKKGDVSELDAMNYKNDLDYLKNNRSAEAYERYKKIAGEIEAREVQARKNLTPNERDLIPHYENAETMGTGHSDEAYNSAFMAKLEGRHGDFDSTGINPEDASLDFSRNKAESISQPHSDKRMEHFRKIVLKDINKEWTDISRGVLKSLRASLSDTFSGKYISVRDDAMVGKHQIQVQADRLATALSKLTDEDNKALQEYITGDIQPHEISPELKKVADNIRLTIKDLQDKLIATGIYDEKDIQAWGEYYLKRFYEKHMTHKIKNIAGGNFKLPYSGNRRGKPETFTQKQYDAKVLSGEIDESLIGKPLREGGLEKNVIGNKIEIRRDWTKAERESMGEITDASVTVPQTIMNMRKMVEHGKLLQEIAKVDGAVISKAEAKLSSPEALNEAGYVEMKHQPQFGALSGQWVRKDVADDIGALSKTLFQQDGDVSTEVSKAWLKYLSRWKKALTVLNLPTHVNNLGANPFLMHASGLNVYEIGTTMSKASLDMFKGLKLSKLEEKELMNLLSTSEKSQLATMRSDLKYLIEAREQGLLNTSRVEDLNVGVEQNYNKKNIFQKIGKGAEIAYQGEDGIGKLAMYSHLREKGWSVKDARTGALSIMPDYSRPMAPIIRKLRDTGITPFISWTYFTLPKMLKLANSARGQVQIAKAVGGTYLLSYALTGIANPYSDLLPDDAHMGRIPISKDGSKITTVKMDRINPFMQMMNPKRMFTEMAGQGLPQTALGLLMGTKIYNGRPITSENKPYSQQLYDKAKYASSLYPIAGQLRSTGGFIESLVRDEKARKISSDIVPRTVLQNAGLLVGANTLTFDSNNVKRTRRMKERRQKINAKKGKGFLGLF